MAILFSKCIASTACGGGAGFFASEGHIFGRHSDQMGFEDLSSPVPSDVLVHTLCLFNMFMG